MLYKKLLGYLISLIIWVMTATITFQIFFRYVLNSPLVWSEELARYLQIWLVIAGTSIVTREGAHPSVAVLVERLPKRWRYCADQCSCLIQLLFWIILLWLSIWFNIVRRPQPAAALQISMGWVYWGATALAVLTVADLLVTFRENLRRHARTTVG